MLLSLTCNYLYECVCIQFISLHCIQLIKYICQLYFSVLGDRLQVSLENIHRGFEVRIACTIFNKHKFSQVSWVRGRVFGISMRAHIGGTTYQIRIYGRAIKFIPNPSIGFEDCELKQLSTQSNSHSNNGDWARIRCTIFQKKDRTMFMIISSDFPSYRQVIVF